MEDIKMIAQQLRKPPGEFANTIAEKMGVGNRPPYDLTLDTMENRDNDSILEIGFGSGSHFPDLFAKAKDLQVTGIDYSAEMTELATQNNETLVKCDRLNLYTGSSDNLPFSESSFDIIFCNMVIYFWDDPTEHLSEIKRVLKPDGKFYTGMRTRKSMLQFPFTKYGFNLFEVEEWKSILEDNGFQVLGENRDLDPAFDEFENDIQLESVCLAAKKN